MTEAEPATIATWRHITGLDVTDVRVLPPVPSGLTTVDGVELQSSDRIVLQIGGAWPEERSTGIYTVGSQ